MNTQLNWLKNKTIYLIDEVINAVKFNTVEFSLVNLTFHKWKDYTIGNLASNYLDCNQKCVQ